jgi:hypothetical protein
MIEQEGHSGMRFVAIKQYKDGGLATLEYFETRDECLRWLFEQPQPEDFIWMVGEY